MLVVCKPLGQITFQKKHALGGIAVSWLWSLAWNLPPLFGWGRYELEGVGTSCAPDWHNRDPNNLSYILAYFTLCFAIPFAIILLSYTKLMWTVHQVSVYTLYIYIYSKYCIYICVAECRTVSYLSKSMQMAHQTEKVSER